MVPELPAKVAVSATVSPSEDPARVAVAVMNVTGEAAGSLEKGDEAIRYTSDGVASLVHLKDQLRDRQVRGAARRLLEYARKGRRTELMVNRQAAHSGVVVLCGSPEESPLGPIYVKIESRKLNELIEWLTAYEAG